VNRVATWLKESPFTRDLGVWWHNGELSLSHDESLTGYGTLHGGAVAALAALSAQAAMRDADPAAAPSTVSLHVTYARGGRGSAFSTTASTVRRVHELGFYAANVCDQDGTVIANASATLADRPPEDAVESRAESVEIGEVVAEPPTALPGDPAEFDAATQAIPFLADRGMRVEGVDLGRLEMTLDPVERNLDGAGAIHEGAALTLLDAAGATVPWTLTRSAKSGATIALHAHFVGRLPAGSLLARAGVRARADRISWCEISLLSVAEHRLCGFGTAVYRFA
jgi:uncharacterized protein (TIGR00369 family)